MGERKEILVSNLLIDSDNPRLPMTCPQETDPGRMVELCPLTCPPFMDNSVSLKIQLL